MELIHDNLNAIREACSKHKVSKLFVFGSVFSPRFSEQSDVDLLVDFKPIDLMSYADNYFDFKNTLQAIFKRNIDLLENQAVKNPVLRATLDNSKVQIYS